MRGPVALASASRPLSRASVFWQASTSRRFLLITVLTAIAYLSFSDLLDLYTGAPVMASATYFALYYPLVAISAVLMGLNVYSFRPRFVRNGVKSGVAIGSTGSATSVFGSVVSCSCHTSLFLPVLTLAGVSVVAGVGIVEAFVEYQFWILTAFIIVDLYLVYRISGNMKGVENDASK